MSPAPDTMTPNTPGSSDDAEVGIREIDTGAPPTRFARGWHCLGLFSEFDDGTPHSVGPPPFDGLEGVGELRFTALATRAKKESYGLIASDYEQPFGTFTGRLPTGEELARGWGVMERHEALW